MKSKTKTTSDKRKRILNSLRNNIRFLTETDIENIELGNVELLASQLDVVSDSGRFTPKTQDDIDHPDRFLLKIIRDPANFPFTCEHVLNVKVFPFQNLFLRELWYRAFPMLIASRGGGKSYILALYAMLRALINQGCKIVIVGSSFRQSKVIFDYCVKIWANAPILRDICGFEKGANNRESGPRTAIDRCDMIIGDSSIVALPIGDGRKIRGQRANYIIADEFAAIDVEIYETVIKGFGSVSQDPVASVEKESFIRVLKKLGYWNKDLEKEYLSTRMGNQAVIAGTADYDFQNFARYWKRQKQIILSHGNKKLLSDVVGPEAVNDIDHRDYCVIRLPHELIPYGFMDPKYIGNAKATVNSSIFAMEYGTVFVSDSDGFFKRSLITKCTCEGANSDVPFIYAPQIRGTKGVKHIIAVDPASEKDNFAVAVLALHKGHRRLVHLWTTNTKFHNERIKAGLEEDHNFYGYTSRKIRELMAAFECERLLIDAGGGGLTLRETLGDQDKLKDGDRPILEVIDPDEPKDSDGRKGWHILEMVNFSDANWVSEANHGMKKDMEDGILTFPKFDPILLELSYEEDKALGRITKNAGGGEMKLYDTLEDVYMEIEALKKELVTIVHTRTPSGRERWDTPDVRTNGVKGRQKKDRYSALLIANMGARCCQRTPAEIKYESTGGFAHVLASQNPNSKNDDGPMYYGTGAEIMNVYGGGKPGRVIQRG